MQTVRVVAAIVDTKKLTLYKDNGTRIEIPQGDPRIQKIVDEVVPVLTKQPYYDLTIEAGQNPFTEFESKSGVVKFFRVAKKKLRNLFAAKVEDEPPPVSPIAVFGANTTDHRAQAVQEIMAHAVPTTDVLFEEGVAPQGNVVEDNGHTLNDRGEQAENTIVAVVDGKIVPGMEKIKTQFARAVKDNPKGVEKFLQRLAAVIDKRQHSVEDLLTFLERGDLPIADDGSILIYKVLNLVKGDKSGRTFVDCHTGLVRQWVGAYVCMDEKMVDHDRHHECSNGLHVARRGYVRQFSGSACVLAKLAPEDVIAVPTYDANKMRVCGYHIIAELTPKQFELVKSNRPITDDPEGKKLLARAMKGQHIARTHEVRITQQHGGGVIVKDLVEGTTHFEADSPAGEVEALANPAQETKANPVDPKKVVKKVEQHSRKDRAQVLVKAFTKAKSKVAKANAAYELVQFKRKSKVSWSTLGISEDLVQEVLSHSGN